MTARYGVLLVGGGRSHQENYALDFGADDRCRLVGIADEEGVGEKRARSNKELADTLGVPLLPDLNRALEREDVHVASVCVEFERRARVARLCARARKHVYIDKPLATTNEDAAALVRAVRDAGVRSQMFSILRTAWVRRARELARSGDLGALTGLHCDLLFPKGPSGTADLTRPRREQEAPERFTFPDAKRELFTTGVYAIGILRALYPRPIVRVYARTSNYFFQEHQGHDIEDFAAFTLEFDDGLVATVTGGRTGWQSYTGFGPMRILLVGNRKTRLVDTARPRLEVASDAPPWRPGPPPPEDPMGFWTSTTTAWGGAKKHRWQTFGAPGGSDSHFFIDCIEAGRESDVNAAEGAEILRVLLAAYASAARGRPVTVT